MLQILLYRWATKKAKIQQQNSPDLTMSKTMVTAPSNRGKQEYASSPNKHMYI